jgi:hypothetical protein
MALWARSPLPLNGHLDGTSGGAGLKGALYTGKPKEALSRHPPTQQRLTSKPEAEAEPNLLLARRRDDTEPASSLAFVFARARPECRDQAIAQAS